MIFKSMCDCMKTLTQVILENIKWFFTVYIYIYIYIYNLHNGECASVFNALLKTRIYI